MADNFTPRLNLTKIEVGASEDTWGEKLNDNSDVVDSHFDAGPALKVASGGTGATDAAVARTNLGLGTLAQQNANNVLITGGGIDGLNSVRLTGTLPRYMLSDTDSPVGNKNWSIATSGSSLRILLYDDAFSSNTTGLNIIRSGNAITSFAITGGPMTLNGNVVWHAGNDGNGSGLDADQLDGQEGTFYTNASNLASGTAPIARLPSSVLRNQGAFTGGTVTISTSAPSGTPAPGDLWLQYV